MRDSALVERMNNVSVRYLAEVDAGHSTLTLAPYGFAKAPIVMVYSGAEGERISLGGTADNVALQIVLRRVDPGAHLLTSRGFHWINEYPVNR